MSCSMRGSWGGEFIILTILADPLRASQTSFLFVTA